MFFGATLKPLAFNFSFISFDSCAKTGMTVAVPLFKQGVHVFGHFALAIFSSLYTGFECIQVSNFDRSVSDWLLE